VKEVLAGGAMSLRAIAGALNGRGITAPRGGSWSSVQVGRLLDRLGPFDESAGASAAWSARKAAQLEGAVGHRSLGLGRAPPPL